MRNKILIALSLSLFATAAYTSQICIVDDNTDCTSYYPGQQVYGEWICPGKPGMIPHDVNEYFYVSSVPTKPWAHWEYNDGWWFYAQNSFECKVYCSCPYHDCPKGHWRSYGKAKHSTVETDSEPTGDQTCETNP